MQRVFKCKNDQQCQLNSNTNDFFRRVTRKRKQILKKSRGIYFRMGLLLVTTANFGYIISCNLVHAKKIKTESFANRNFQKESGSKEKY